MLFQDTLCKETMETEQHQAQQNPMHVAESDGVEEKLL